MIGFIVGMVVGSLVVNLLIYLFHLILDKIEYKKYGDSIKDFMSYPLD